MRFSGFQTITNERLVQIDKGANPWHRFQRTLTKQQQKAHHQLNLDNIKLLIITTIKYSFMKNEL